MKSKYIKIIFGTVAVLLVSDFQRARAQYDPMFTQYMFNEMFINPAYAGSRDAISMTALYRNQWVGIDGAPKTQTFSIHAPVASKKIGIGMSVLNEVIGVTHRTAFYADYAYRVQWGQGFFSMGLQGGLVSQQEKLSDIQTSQQGDQVFIGNTPHVLVPNAGFGMYYFADRFYVGLSVPRVIQNKIEVNANTDVVTHNVSNLKDFHYYLTAAYVLTVDDNVKLKPCAMIKAVQGAPFEGDFSVNALFKEFLWLGVSYRTGADASATMGLQLTRQLRLGYAYDYSLTELQNYNSGSHEITLGYDFSFNKKKIITPRYF